MHNLGDIGSDVDCRIRGDLTLLGIFLVKTKEGASQQQLLRALDRGINVSSLLIVGASFLVIYLLGLSYWICGSVIVGL